MIESVMNNINLSTAEGKIYFVKMWVKYVFMFWMIYYILLYIIIYIILPKVDFYYCENSTSPLCLEKKWNLIYSWSTCPTYLNTNKVIVLVGEICLQPLVNNVILWNSNETDCIAFIQVYLTGSKGKTGLKGKTVMYSLRIWIKLHLNMWV